MKHQQKNIGIWEITRNLFCNEPMRWGKHLFLLTIITCFFTLSLNVTHAGTTKYYTFLATKYNKDGKVEEAPSIQNSKEKLINIPVGDYYLHIVILSEGGYWESDSYKFVVQKSNNGIGVDVTDILPLTDRPIDQYLVDRNLGPLIAVKTGMPKGNPLPTLLRKLVVSGANPSLFSGNSIKIERLHKLTSDQLTLESLRDLWSVWDYKTLKYDINKTITENIRILEEDITTAFEQGDGFIHSTKHQMPSEEQNELLQVYLRHVTNLSEKYKSRIQPLIDASNKKAKEVEGLRNIAYKDLLKAKGLLNNGSEQQIKPLNTNYLDAEKNYNNSIEKSKEATILLNAESFTKISSLLEDAKTSARQASKEAKSIAKNIRKIQGKNEPVDLGKIIVFSVLVSLFVLVALFLIMPAFFKKFLRVVGLKNRKKQSDDGGMGTDGNSGSNTTHTPQSLTGNQQSNKQPLGIPPSDVNLQNNDKKTYNLKGDDMTLNNDQVIDDLRENVQKLERENKRLKDMIYLKDKELRRIANKRSFFETLFANKDVRYLIKDIVDEKVKQEVDKEIKVKLREFYHQFPGLKQLQKKALPASNPQNIDNTNNGTNQLTGKQENIRIETVNETSQQIETNYSENEGLFGVLVESTIIRKTEMQRDFSTVIKDDLFLAKSIPGWMKSKMPPSLYRQLDTELAKYKKGKIRLVIPDIDDVFNPEDHELTATREKEMRGTGGRVSKVIKPGIKMRAEKGGSSIISRAQVEIKT